MADNRRFRRGSSAYNCFFGCGERIRDTGQGEASLELCLACKNEAERLNYHSDHDHDPTVNPQVCFQCKEGLG